MDESLKRLAETVKFNCDVSDARYWGYYSICGLLMGLRALFMSNNGIKPWGSINQEEISKWISQKEAYWEEIEDKEFKKLEIAGRLYDPFDVTEINLALNRKGLVYGAGYGVFKKPSFFLADLYMHKNIDGYTVYAAKREYARDLFISPGLLQGGYIFIRLEPLRALLWDKYQESKAKNNPVLAYGFFHHGFSGKEDIDADFERKFDKLTGSYSEIILYHELGEVKENLSVWMEMLYDADSKDTEFFLRAVKDMLADTSDFGPLKRSIDSKNKGNLGLCIALLDRYKAKMHLPIRRSFERFIESGDWNLIDEARKATYLKIAELRDELIKDYTRRSSKEDFLRRLLETKAKLQ